MKRSFLTYALLLVAFVAGAQQRAFTVGQYNIRYDEPNSSLTVSVLLVPHFLHITLSTPFLV